jgi:hypothetical protein
VRQRLNHFAVVQHLEHRVLFSVLDDLHGVSADLIDVDAPSATPGTQLPRTHAVVDADLRWLANDAGDVERPALAMADSDLLTLYRRARRGVATSALGQLVDGVDVSTSHIVRDDGVPLVHMQVADVPAVAARLRAMGVDVAGVVDKGNWKLVDAYVPIRRVLDVAGVPGVQSMQAQPQPQVDASGAAFNEWDSLSGASRYRSMVPDDDGSGITFGVISNSIDKVGQGIAGSQDSGDLPRGNRVTVLDDGKNSDDDEGRAMAELIYDVAPGADIVFHTGHGGINHFANGIDDLRAAGADVIVDDMRYANEPAFQDGAIAQAVDDVYLDHKVLYFSSNGNLNSKALLDTWNNPDGDDFHNFEDGGEVVRISLPGNTKSQWFLQFDDEWGHAGANYEIQVFDYDGNVVGDMVKASNDDNTPPIIGGGNPYDALTINNRDNRSHQYAIAIKHLGGHSPAGQRLFLYSFDSQFTTLDSNLNNEPSGYGHSNARWGFGIGAVPAGNPGAIEPYSSLGSVPIVFDDAGNPMGPVVRDNPAFVAADAVTTSLRKFRNFTGTSAAAPNAAAIAGLMLQANGGHGSLTWTQFRDLARDTAVDLGAPGYDTTFGHGRIDALAALVGLRGPQRSEQTLVLNQFGRATLTSQMLVSNSDFGTFTFAGDTDGVGLIAVSNPEAPLDAALMLFNADDGSVAGYNYDAVGNRPLLLPDLESHTLYEAEVFNQAANFSVSGYDFAVTVPPPAVTDVHLDAHGDASISTAIVHADSDYFRVTMPGTMSKFAKLFVTLDPAATLDGEVHVFDGGGNFLTFDHEGNVAGPGGVENVMAPLNMHFPGPGDEFVVRVGGAGYASEGDYTVSFHVELDLPPTLTAAQAQGTAIFNHDGVSNDASDFNLNIGTPGDVDSLVFAGNAGWDGTYQVTVRSTGAGDLSPVAGVYDGATGKLLAFGRAADADPGSVTLTFDGTGLTKYVLAAGDAWDVAGHHTGDLAFTITAPGRNAGTALAPDALGDAALEDRTLSPAADSDFYRFTVPAGVTGGKLRVFAGDGLDSMIALFDDAGTFVDSRDSAEAGLEDVLPLRNLVPGQTYRVTVLPDRHASSGDYAVQLDLDVPVGTVRGRIYEDVDGNGARDAGEPGLHLWMAYADLNGNGIYDKLVGGQEEPHALTDRDGVYEMTDVPVGTWPVREDVQPGWGQLSPEDGSGPATLDAAGDIVTGMNFGNYRGASQPVRSWQDDDADGAVDAGEPPLAGRRVWVDYDNDFVFDPGTEPFAVTGIAGLGTITGIRPGTWSVREVLPDRTWVRTAPPGGAGTVTLLSGQTGGAVRFGSYRPLDFGDAPATYGTTLAAGGAVHWAHSPWYLGRRVDSELDGAPSAGADADDRAGTPRDEDGVTFLDPLTRGSVARVAVRASRSGRLNAWIDLNADGDFLDAGDFVLNNVPVPGRGVYLFHVAVPQGATLGNTYARFRFNAAGGIGPVCLGLEGEVEDYAVRIVPPAGSAATLFGDAPITAAAPSPAAIASRQTLLGIREARADGLLTA